MKRFLSVLLCAALLCSCLSIALAEDKQTLTVWIPQYQFSKAEDAISDGIEKRGVDYGEDAAIETAAPIRFRLPADAPLREVGRHLVTYADVDVNRHMNNTKYADLLCSYLPMDGARVSAMSWYRPSRTKPSDTSRPL